MRDVIWETGGGRLRCEKCDQPMAMDEAVWVIDVGMQQWNICPECFASGTYSKLEI